MPSTRWLAPYVNVGAIVLLVAVALVVLTLDQLAKWQVVKNLQMGVPVHQVKEFAPRFSFGCSISTPPYLALALLDHPDQAREVAHDWPHLATYYAMITGEGRGTVRIAEVIDTALVRVSRRATSSR